MRFYSNFPNNFALGYNQAWEIFIMLSLGTFNVCEKKTKRTITSTKTQEGIMQALTTFNSSGFYWL